MVPILKKVNFTCFSHLLDFKFEAGTSRGKLTKKETFIIRAEEKNIPAVHGWGEAGPLKGLSVDDVPDFGKRVAKLCQDLSGKDIKAEEEGVLLWVASHIPAELPSLRFAFETALLDLCHGGVKKIFDCPFYESREAIPINGLIWMGDRKFMLEQIDLKLKEGYRCIKMKIGAIDFEQECDLLGYIRSHYDDSKLTLRVDANGAFNPDNVMDRLEQLSKFNIHSIEQPIKAGQLDAMRTLCACSPLPIALDEELIGIGSRQDKIHLLEAILPQYIILKPSLVGGVVATREWIELAENFNVGWWMTSALESNIGLNAIAQLTSSYSPTIPQGLGTGQLYTTNFESPLSIQTGELYYNTDIQNWNMENLGLPLI